MRCRKRHVYDDLDIANYDYGNGRRPKNIVKAMNKSIEGLAFKCTGVKHKGCRK